MPDDIAPPQPRPGPGRPARISRRAIGRAALDVGLAHATVTAVAGALGVDHSTLYRHISGAAEIPTLAAAEAISATRWTTPDGDWRALLEHLATTLWQLLEDVPGLAGALLSFETQPDAAYTAFSETVEALVARGFDYTEAGRVTDLLVDLTVQTHAGYAALSEPGGGALRARLLAHADRVAQARPDLARAAAEATRMIGDDPAAHWRWRMQLLLDGVAARRG